MYYTNTTIRFEAASGAVKLAFKLVPGTTAATIVTTMESG